VTSLTDGSDFGERPSESQDQDAEERASAVALRQSSK
jgi:hypothetical protein